MQDVPRQPEHCLGQIRNESGKISIMGKDGQLHEVTINSPQDAVKYGIGYLSEDRRRYGVVVQKICNREHNPGYHGRILQRSYSSTKPKRKKLQRDM